MRRKVYFFIIVNSILVAFAVRIRSNLIYETVNKNAAEAICDIVALRAQSGSTRDVYDQAFLILRKYALDPDASVVIKNGDKVYGSSPSQAGTEQVSFSCAIGGAPDYKIISSFSRRYLFSSELSRTVVVVAIFLLALSFLAKLVMVQARNFWLVEILAQIRLEIGLDAVIGSELHPYWLRPWLAAPLSGLRTSIETLKADLKRNQSGLLRTEMELRTHQLESRLASAFEEKVRMVRHDIRGPLSAMKIAAASNGELKVLPGVISAIETMAQELERKVVKSQNDDVNDIQFEIAEVVILEAVLEKRQLVALRPNVTIDIQHKSESRTVINVNRDYFRRIITNVLQNSVESFGANGGVIKVESVKVDGFLEVTIADNGKGIGQDLIPHLFQKGKTFGKVGGSGLGLFFVGNCIESWGGIFDIVSSVGLGTSVTLKIPLYDIGVSFIAPDKLLNFRKTAFLDDQIEVFQPLWENSDANEQIFFESIDRFIDWFSAEKHDHAIVVDFHLRDEIDGLDVIRTIGKRSNVFLATTDYLNTEALEVAKEYNVSIIPKPLLGLPAKNNKFSNRRI